MLTRNYCYPWHLRVPTTLMHEGTGAEAASQQRYHNYTSDQTEPDYETLMRICRALDTEPNVVLGFSAAPLRADDGAVLRARIAAATGTMVLPTLKVTAAIVETLAREHEPEMVRLPTATGRKVRARHPRATSI